MDLKSYHTHSATLMQSIHRRNFLKTSAAAAVSAALQPIRSGAATAPALTDPAKIEARVKAARPLLGGTIPADLKDKLGITHYDGHYHLTDKPFLIEGAEAINRLGSNVAKFWLHEEGLPGYGYNTDASWAKALKTGRLVDVLRHPNYVEALSQPFTTVFLEAFPLVGDKKSFFAGENNFADEEDQFHEVAAHLFKTYADRDITFILQNWEGDWMLRREEGGTWNKVPSEEIKRRCDAFIRFLTARQRGVDRARKEAAPSRCKVYHAAEVNRVWDGTKGIPTLTTHVLPHVTLDLVSWSCYDGLKDPVATWQGIELIRQSMRPSPTFGDDAVFIGEVGRPETGLTETEVVEFWDRTMGVFLAMNIPWVVHWELYCNEPIDAKTKPDRRPRQQSEMNGFWFLRPDGTLSHSGKYLTTLLKNAGKKLSAEEVRSLTS